MPAKNSDKKHRDAWPAVSTNNTARQMGGLSVLRRRSDAERANQLLKP
jgi:hypothetical protein